MDNHKPVTISILHLKHDKNVFLSFLENMHEKSLGFDCMHENKTFIFNKIFLDFLRINQIFFVLVLYLIV